MRKICLRFYLFWTLLNVLIYHLPVPQSFTDQYPSLLIIVIVGVYFLAASSLTHRVMNSAFSLQRNEVLGYLFMVGLVMAAAVLYSRSNGSFGIIGSALATANILFGATVLGSVLSTAIKRIGELVPVCITAAVADAISVSKGPTKAFAADLTVYYEGGMAGPAPLVDFIIIKAGLPGLEARVPLFGVTDWIFVVVLSSALVRLGKTDNLLSAGKKSGEYLFFPVSALALYLGFIVAQVTGTFVPAMVFMTSFFLVFLVLQYNLHKKLKRADIYYSCFFPCAVAVVLLLYSHEFSWRDILF